MNKYKVGHFYEDKIKSNYPVIISILGNNNSLVCKVEYCGDYYWRSNNMLKKKYFTPYQKLATIGKFSPWWYSSHKIMFQKILIECINEIKYINNTKKI